MSTSRYTEITDQELLSKMKESSEDAFTIIYQKYNKMLYVLAYKYLKDNYLAEDIVQRVFLKFWESRLFLQEDMHLRNYLYTMAKNMVLNEIRNNNRVLVKHYELMQCLPEFEEKLGAALDDSEITEQVKQVLEKLPEQKKKVCWLKIFQNLSNQDIAEKLNISIPTVKTHYSIGIKFVRQNLQKIFLVFGFFLSNLFMD